MCRAYAYVIRVTALICVLVVAATGTSPAEAAEPGGLDQAPFQDTRDHMFSQEIRRMYDWEITYGCNPPQNTLYCPEDHVTRGQMAAFLVRAFHLRPTIIGDTTADFEDTEGHTFEAEIAALQDFGVTEGCNPPNNTRFCPDRPITRGEMAEMLVRSRRFKAEKKAAFEDAAGHMFGDAIATLAGAGVVRGCNPPDNTRFCPDRPITRGEMAAFIVRSVMSSRPRPYVVP